MDLINVKVIHKVYGTGKIITVLQQYVTVDFDSGCENKTFIQPGCFGKYLFFADKSKETEFEKEKLDKAMQIEIEEKKRRELIQKNIELQKSIKEQKEKERVCQIQKAKNEQHEKNQSFHYKFLETLKRYGFEGFHHYTDFSNLGKIFEKKKLYCRAKAEIMGFLDGAETSIINHTPEKVLNSVRFYFKECTPTLYRNEGIKNQIGVDDEYIAHMPIPVLLLFDENILFTEDIAVSNGGCGNSSSVITYDLETALKFDWESIFKRGGYAIPDEVTDEKSYKKTISNTRNAEFLFPEEISIDNIKSIVFRCPADKKHAEFKFGTNKLFCVNQSKFNVKNGYPENRNYLYDYDVNRTQSGFKGKLYFESDPTTYKHSVRYIKNGFVKKVPLNLEIKGNIAEFEINAPDDLLMVEYLLNDFISAVWS